jgi:RNA polymerase sigma factor (TIGR02999 family)
MASPPARAVTALLQEVSAGRREALDTLLPLVYGELRQIANRALRKERSNHTLQATAIVHEAYLKLVDQRETRWQNRAHFFAIAAQAIRRILIDYARDHGRLKRGGDRERVTLDDASAGLEPRSIDLLALDEALTRLAKVDARQAQIVELRFFGGLSVEETAEVIGMSAGTVAREWTYSKAWLHAALTGGVPDE